MKRCLRNVYHHVTEPAAFNKSLYATAKPGAPLVIIDAPPGHGSELPSGVPANRGGHGVPPRSVIDESTAAGFVHVRTIQGVAAGNKYPTVFLALFEKVAGGGFQAVPEYDAIRAQIVRLTKWSQARHVAGEGVSRRHAARARSGAARRDAT